MMFRRLVALLLLLGATTLPAAAFQMSGGGVPGLGDCQDIGGNHLNYNLATNVWSCGASGSGGSPGNAFADGVTKGVVAFPAVDFDCTSGICAIDWTNTQKASASVPGALSAADWTTFTAKVPPTRTLTGGFGMQTIGDLSANRTVAMVAPGADDQIYVSDSSSGATWRTIPDCTDVNGQHLNYTAATNLLGCGTSSSGGGGAVSSVFGRAGAVTAVAGDYTDALISFTDITTNNVSTLKHGYVPKLSGNANEFFNGVGGYTTPAGGGNVSVSGTPANGQIAQWISASTIQGLATTGTGNAVLQTAPTFVTGVTSPVLIGGTGTTASLIYKTTTGVGATGADHIWQIGTNGGTEGMRLLNNGNVGVGTAAPGTRFHLLGPSAELRHTGSGATQTLTYSFYDNNTTLEGALSYLGGAAGGSRFLSLSSTATDGVQLLNINDVALRFATNNLLRASLGSAVFSLGFNGVTNPTFRVNYASGAVETGIDVTGAAAGTAPIIAAISSGSNESLQLDAKGTGGLRLLINGTGNLSLGGETARTLKQLRRTGSVNPGLALTLEGGDAATGSTDKDAGGVILSTGLSTGTGRGLVVVKGTTSATATGTSDNVLVEREIVNAWKTLADNATTTVANLTVASNTAAAVIVTYGVEVFNGTDVQVESGIVNCKVTNKGGVFTTPTCVKVGNDGLATAGTLAVTWTVTGANPSAVQVNADSSLTPSAGYPRLSFSLKNVTSQAVSIP